MSTAVQAGVRPHRGGPEWAAYSDARHAGAGQYAYASLIGLKSFNAISLHEAAKAGLTFRKFELLQRALDLPASTLAEIIQIPPRTLQRRKEAGRLAPDESDRLLRSTRLVGMALELFEGDLDAARTWLATPRGALGGATPLDLLQTEPGAQEVENLIGRLEHGVVV